MGPATNTSQIMTEAITQLQGSQRTKVLPGKGSFTYLGMTLGILVLVATALMVVLVKKRRINSHYRASNLDLSWDDEAVTSASQYNVGGYNNDSGNELELSSAVRFT